MQNYYMRTDNSMKQYHSGYFINDEDIFETFSFGLKMKNGIIFKFLGCYYVYSNEFDDPYLEIYYYSEDSNVNNANAQLKKSSRALSFIFGIPLAEIQEFSEPTEIEANQILLETPCTKKIVHLHNIENMIVALNDKIDLFYLSMNHFYSGLKFLCMTNFDEEAFINLFKLIEIISEQYFIDNQESLINFDGNNLNTYLKRYIFESTKINYSVNKMKNITDNVKKCIVQQSTNGVFSKISFFCNHYNIKFEANELNIIVSIRNQIAHGDPINHNQLDSCIMNLYIMSRNIISHYFFSTAYNKIELECKCEAND